MAAFASLQLACSVVRRRGPSPLPMKRATHTGAAASRAGETVQIQGLVIAAHIRMACPVCPAWCPFLTRRNAMSVRTQNRWC